MVHLTAHNWQQQVFDFVLSCIAGLCIYFVDLVYRYSQATQVSAITACKLSADKKMLTWQLPTDKVIAPKEVPDVRNMHLSACVSCFDLHFQDCAQILVPQSH